MTIKCQNYSSVVVSLHSVLLACFHVLLVSCETRHVLEIKTLILHFLLIYFEMVSLMNAAKKLIENQIFLYIYFCFYSYGESA